jgi:hypothetical protein
MAIPGAVGVKIAAKVVKVLKTYKIVIKPEILGTIGANVRIERRFPIERIKYAKIDSIIKQRSHMEAIITKDLLDTGSRPKASFTDADVPGYKGKTNGTDRGHLLANRLGGSGDLAENLVAIYARHNRGVMRVFEDDVYKLAEEGKVVKYRVTPEYAAPNNLEIPKTIKLEAWVDGHPIPGSPTIFNNIP